MRQPVIVLILIPLGPQIPPNAVMMVTV